MKAIDSLDSFAKVAPFLTNPFVLIGFALLVLASILKTLLKSHILSPVTSASSSKIVQRLLNGTFVIAVLLIVLGFAFAAWSEYLKAKTVRRKGFMQVGEVWFVNKRFDVGDRLGINVWVKNMGDEPVQSMFHFIKVALIEPHQMPQADWDYHKVGLQDALKFHEYDINQGHKGVRVGAGDGVWTTTMLPSEPSPPLTQTQVDEFMQGKLKIYVYVWARWRDAEEDLDFCESLQTPTTNDLDKDKLIWHLCAPE